MRAEQGRNSKTSWPKVVKKWLNKTNGTTEQETSTNDTNCSTSSVVHEKRRMSSDRDEAEPASETAAGKEESLGSEDSMHRNRPRSGFAQNLRMFVGTWNVGGRTPHAGLNLRDWLTTPAPADIYVLGFQEIVPLNAGNVLGTKDRVPAARWIALIREALRATKTTPPLAENYSDATDRTPKTRISFSDLITIEDMMEEEEEDYEELEDLEEGSNSSDEESAEVFPIGATSFSRRVRKNGCGGGYYLVGSKQMVGIFLCVWAKADVLMQVSRFKVSCVPRGVMGCMGNKGSISISMTVRRTTFCFVCTHLASGEKEKDEIRRNSDVGDIMKKTRFPRSRRRKSSSPTISPKTILQHDKVVWLGDLNYRLNTSFGETHELLRNNDWEALLEMDQLRIEQKGGRIFAGWEEGRIYFPPTYKYLTNSDQYAAETAKPGEKKRTPAWCDRILWRGTGMKQLCYVRGESRFSDHRPVYSIFLVHVPNDAEETNTNTSNTKNKWQRKSTDGATTSNTTTNTTTTTTANSCSRVQAEELFPISRSHSCIETSRFR